MFLEKCLLPLNCSTKLALTELFEEAERITRLQSPQVL